MLARHLLQLAYNLSIRAVDTIYLTDYYRYAASLITKRQKVPQQISQAETVG